MQLVNSYEQQRSQHPTLEHFIPELVCFYDHVPGHLVAYEGTYQQRCARVITVEQFSNQATLVSSGDMKFASPLTGNSNLLICLALPSSGWPTIQQ